MTTESQSLVQLNQPPYQPMASHCCLVAFWNFLPLEGSCYWSQFVWTVCDSKSTLIIYNTWWLKMEQLWWGWCWLCHSVREVLVLKLWSACDMVLWFSLYILKGFFFFSLRTVVLSPADFYGQWINLRTNMDTVFFSPLSLHVNHHQRLWFLFNTRTTWRDQRRESPKAWVIKDMNGETIFKLCPSLKVGIWTVKQGLICSRDLIVNTSRETKGVCSNCWQPLFR